MNSKKKRFRGLDICFRHDRVAYGWTYLLPSVEYRHKYWYLWELAFSWLTHGFTIELCRKDWQDYNE